MEIYSKGEYPADALSNFAAHTFVMDGVTCGSMEGFLQSLKYRNPAKQRAVCALVGATAKAAGKHKILWKLCRAVWWNGEKIGRTSAAFAALISRAYDALYTNEAFRAALAASAGEPLTHSIGREDPRKTVLTVFEFLGELLRLRDLQANEQTTNA